MNAAATETREIIAADEMVGSLMSITLDELKQQSKVWHLLSEDEQEAVIARIDKRVREAVRQCVDHVAAAGFTRVPAKIDGIAIKGEVKATLKIAAPQSDAAVHRLFDSQGLSCMVVLADASEFAEQAHDHEPDADQLGLALKGIGDSDAARPDTET